jgi:hypothetical protein
MPVLTCHRDLDRKEECWLIYYGDGHVGTIFKIASYPPQWEWRCGFYPGSEPGEDKAGTATTFGQDRVAGIWTEFKGERGTKSKRCPALTLSTASLRRRMRSSSRSIRRQRRLQNPFSYQ